MVNRRPPGTFSKPVHRSEQLAATTKQKQLCVTIDIVFREGQFLLREEVHSYADGFAPRPGGHDASIS
jgi:hypothetical protein